MLQLRPILEDVVRANRARRASPGADSGGRRRNRDPPERQARRPSDPHADSQYPRDLALGRRPRALGARGLPLARPPPEDAQGDRLRPPLRRPRRTRDPPSRRELRPRLACERAGVRGCGPGSLRHRDGHAQDLRLGAGRGRAPGHRRNSAGRPGPSRDRLPAVGSADPSRSRCVRLGRLRLCSCCSSCSGGRSPRRATSSGSSCSSGSPRSGSRRSAALRFASSPARA